MNTGRTVVEWAVAGRAVVSFQWSVASDEWLVISAGDS